MDTKTGPPAYQAREQRPAQDIHSMDENKTTQLSTPNQGRNEHQSIQEQGQSTSKHKGRYSQPPAPQPWLWQCVNPRSEARQHERAGRTPTHAPQMAIHSSPPIPHHPSASAQANRCPPSDISEPHREPNTTQPRTVRYRRLHSNISQGDSKRLHRRKQVSQRKPRRSSKKQYKAYGMTSRVGTPSAPMSPVTVATAVHRRASVTEQASIIFNESWHHNHAISSGCVPFPPLTVDGMRVGIDRLRIGTSPESNPTAVLEHDQANVAYQGSGTGDGGNESSGKEGKAGRGRKRAFSESAVGRTRGVRDV